MSQRTPEQEAYEAIHAYFSRPDARLAKIDEGEEWRNPSCVYRDQEDHGVKCAVGCLISDKLYDALLEQDFDLEKCGTIFGIQERLAPRMADGENGVLAELAEIIGFSGGDAFMYGRLTLFLRDAQMAHDDNATETVEQFLTKLDEVASDYRLTLVQA